MCLTEAAEYEFQGCNKMLHMILVQAILDLDYVAPAWEGGSAYSPVGYSVYVREQARRWILEDEDDGITSFVGICKVIDIDPMEFRNRFRRKLYRRNEVVNGKAVRIYNNTNDKRSDDILSRSLIGSKIQL